MAKLVVLGSYAHSLINFRGDLLRELVRRSHEVVALAPEGPAEVALTLQRWGVHYESLALQRTGTSLLGDLRFFWALCRCLKRHQPQALLSYTIKPVIYGSLAARLIGVPRIAAMITGLGFTFMPSTRWRTRAVQAAARFLYRLALKRAHVIFFQNADDEREFRSHRLLPASARVAQLNGSGVHLERYPYVPWPPGRMNFLFIGRLNVDKGIGEFIAAARHLQRIGAAAECHVVGPFDENPSALPSAVLDAAVQDGAIQYHGAVKDVRPYLRNCHVFVLPSYREGTPRSVLEAMATGRPALTTDAPGCRETVEHGISGWLVPPRNPDALAEMMEAICRYDLVTLAEFGKAARIRAESKYDVHAVNAVIIDTWLSKC